MPTTRDMPCSPRARATLLLALLPCALAPLSFGRAVQRGASEDKDTVVLKDGKSESGQIKAEDYAGVKLEARPGSARVIPWADVKTIEYADAADLAGYRSSLDAGRYEEALGQLEDLLAESKHRPVVRQQALFYIAWVRQRMGALDEAAAAWNELIQAFPTGRYLRQATENLAITLLSKRDFPGAFAAVERVSAAAQGAQGFEAEAELVRGRVLEAQKKPTEALVAYDRSEKAAGGSAAVALEAQLGRARCLVQSGKKTEAEAILRKAASSAASPQVLTAAWNGLADIASKDGFDKRDDKLLFEGLYGYLRGVVQYKPQPGEPSLDYEHALAGAARCFKLISEIESNQDRKKIFADRARIRLDEFKREYPNSVFLEQGP